MISSIINSFRFLSFLRKHLGRIIEPLLLFLLALEKNHNFWKDKTCPNSLYLFNCLNKHLGHNMSCWLNKAWGPNGHIQSTKVSQACVPSKSGFHAEGVRLAPRHEQDMQPRSAQKISKSGCSALWIFTYSSWKHLMQFFFFFSNMTIFSWSCLVNFEFRREKLNIFHSSPKWRRTVTTVLVLAISAEEITEPFSEKANLFIHRSVTDRGHNS